MKPIKAKPQYKPPDDKMAHETSYSAQFKGEANKPTPADNKVIDRRRIRSLYSEPFKEPPKVRQILWGNPSAQPRTEGLIAAEREGRLLQTLAQSLRAPGKPLLFSVAHRH